MTTIVGVETEEGCVIGCDSLVAYDDELSYVVRTDVDKIWRTRDTVMGVAGSIRIGQALKHYLVVPSLPKQDSLEDWMVTDFVGAVRHALTEAGHGNGESPWTLLIGVADTLWMVDAGMGVTRCQDGHLAIGSGAGFAMGSLYTTKMMDIAERQIAKDMSARVFPPITPEARIHFALASAERYNAATNDPYIILNNYPYLQLVPEVDDDED